MKQSGCRHTPFFGALLLAACSSHETDPARCPARSEQALMHAASEETYLGLGPEQITAIVQVTDGSGEGSPLCTGVFVADQWLVTAAHCLAIESPLVIVSAEGVESVVHLALETIPHPSADVALIKVDHSEGSVSFRPIPAMRSNDMALAVGDLVEIAGYGINETGDTRELRFLSEPVVELDDESLVVDGFGASGACLGDSGGPLIVRAPSGPVLVAGVLSAGSASCLERDRYVRLDGLDEWVSGIVGSSLRGDETCGGITHEGRCLYGSALHCDGETLVADPCAGDAACGWDRDQAGFRCVTSGDPCLGVDSVGACRDGAATWCRGGVLEREHCDCGEVCRIDGRTGGPRCADPEEVPP